jgi:hypothetical protein
MKLVERTPKGYRACRERILAFLPARHERRQGAELPDVGSPKVGSQVETVSLG